MFVAAVIVITICVLCSVWYLNCVTILSHWRGPLCHLGGHVTSPWLHDIILVIMIIMIMIMIIIMIIMIIIIMIIIIMIIFANNSKYP